jgi:glycosyltransferase involved in cell wall biosynthesis
MRILHVNKFLHRRGGAESYMLDLAERQRAGGHEVAFFAMDHPDNFADPNADLFPSLMELNPPPARLPGRGMERMLERVKPDVVHLHNIYHQLSPSVLRPIRERGIASVMTLHDYKLVCPTYQLLDDGKICEACLPRKFMNAAVRKCNRGSTFGSVLSAVETGLHAFTGAYDSIDLLLCPSEFMQQKMVEGGIDRRRLVHLTNFCDVSSVSSATEAGRGVLYAGRLSREKGVDVLVDAVAHLPAEVHVTIAGDGPDRRALQSRAASLGVIDRVTFLGRIPAAEVHHRMREAAAIVVPSRWYENQPMTILEAFGAGRPVVASRLGGMPELIKDGETGLLVSHDQPRPLALALRELLDDPVRSHEMGKRARSYAVAHHDVHEHVAALSDRYEEARARAGAAA